MAGCAWQEAGSPGPGPYRPPGLPMEYVFSFLPPRLQSKLLTDSGRSGRLCPGCAAPTQCRQRPVSLTLWELHAGEHVSVRSAALRLLMAFVGAQLASLYSVQAFVQHAYACYRCRDTVCKVPCAPEPGLTTVMWRPSHLVLFVGAGAYAATQFACLEESYDWGIHTV